jgi:hypothetical protein
MKTAVAAGAAGLALVAALLPAAVARPAYRLQAIRQLGIPGSTLSRNTMACTYCHAREGGGAPWNPFGEAIRAAFRAEPEAGFPEALYLTLATGNDADRDGYPNAVEVFARTLPGDPASRPQAAPEAVARELEEAGGVERYRPKPPARP